MSPVLGVSQLNFYLRSVLEENPHLQPILVKGEVTACRTSMAGHHFFTLSEQESSISCMIPSKTAARMRQFPQVGDSAVVQATVYLGERDSALLLTVQDYLPSGGGKKATQKKAYLEQLRQQGALSPEKKKPIPMHIFRVGLVTAPQSAAYGDFLSVLEEDGCGFEILFAPATVQGSEAPESVARALQKLDALSLDVIVCTRGGGGKEDLEAFDHQTVVETALLLKTPLISAVGHEMDVSLLDLVADLRRMTPTAAAKYLSGIWQEEIRLIELRRQQFSSSLERHLLTAESRTSQLKMMRTLSPAKQFLLPAEEKNAARRERIVRETEQVYLQSERKKERLQIRLERQMEKLLWAKEISLKQLTGKLTVLGPMETLRRGYAIPVRKSEEGLCKGEIFRLIFAAEEATVQVMEHKRRGREEGNE